MNIFNEIDWYQLIEIVYSVLLFFVCLRIVYDTRSTGKAFAYMLLAIFVPVAGIIFYFTFGVNFRKRKLYSKKLVTDSVRLKELSEKIIIPAEELLALNPEVFNHQEGLINLLLYDNFSPLTTGNSVKLLINGEQKFPEVMEAINTAQNHIHLEYYIYEDDEIGNRIKDLLIKKSKQGVKIRLIYDGFGSRAIRKKIVGELRNAGIEAFPFNRIRLLFFANRINYRNHRKIIIIDGKTGFTGGINISDEYINTDSEKKLYWRDTHLRIDGPGILMLQHIFLCDWNFCSGQKIGFDKVFFDLQPVDNENVCLQIASSGPDSPNSTIMLSMLKAITLARKEILITTPYFIPAGSIMDGIKMAALSGVKVNLLVPEKTDIIIVNIAAHSYFSELLKSGVRIFLYKKGFVHAKSMVIDRMFSLIGTANMNHRSFNLDFEVNAHVYDAAFSSNLANVFYKDLDDSTEINYSSWRLRPVRVKLLERIARLFSPVM